MRNKLAKNSIAVGLVTLIVTAGLSFSAQSAPNSVAQAASHAIKGTGIFASPLDLDTGTCSAELPAGTLVGAPAATPVSSPAAGRCGASLSIPGIGVLDQRATASLSGADGISTANASAAPINIADLGPTLDIGAILDGLDNFSSATIVGTAVGVLDPIIDVVKVVALNALIPVINSVLQPLLAAVDTTLPISLSTDTVSSVCEANPTTATGSSVLAPVHLKVNLTSTTAIDVPITLGTTPNADALIGSNTAAQQLVDGLIRGVVATAILDPVLKPLLDVVDGLLINVTTTIVDPLIAALEAPLLTPVGTAIAGLVSVKSNVQTPVSPAADQIDVTALSVKLFGTNELNLANVHCGPNALATNAAAAPAAPAAPAAAAPAAAGPGSPDADAAADADNQADADVTSTLPATGSPNLLPFWMLGLGLLLFGATVLLNEKRRLES